jgi:hypothetical protein
MTEFPGLTSSKAVQKDAAARRPEKMEVRKL